MEFNDWLMKEKYDHSEAKQESLFYGKRLSIVFVFWNYALLSLQAFQWDFCEHVGIDFSISSLSIIYSLKGLYHCNLANEVPYHLQKAFIAFGKLENLLWN